MSIEEILQDISKLIQETNNIKEIEASKYSMFIKKINAENNEAGMVPESPTKSNNQESGWIGYIPKKDNLELANEETKNENPEINTQLFK